MEALSRGIGRKKQIGGGYADCCNDAPDQHGPCNANLLGLCKM